MNMRELVKDLLAYGLFLMLLGGVGGDRPQEWLSGVGPNRLL
jgi:hypothetical protein